MSSLVADYGSSSESESGDEVHDFKGIKGKERTSQATEVEKLPLPRFGEDGVANSVFKNPFVEEENAKSAILEKHVKMIPAKEDITQINGKQICWMYRKGRCRFGHNCKFAHDSDLYSESPADTSEQSETGAVCDIVTKSEKVDKPVDGEVTKKKKRPGLTQGLVPGKKVVNMYKKQKLGSNKA